MSWFFGNKIDPLDEVLANAKTANPTKKVVIQKPSNYMSANEFTVGGVYEVGYDGEKTPNELGIPKIHVPDFQRVAIRSWQSYLESDTLATLINRLEEWVLGSGIELVSTPKSKLLENLGLTIRPEKMKAFSELYEDLFSITKNSNKSTHNQRWNLDEASISSLITAWLTGDVLAIYRYIDDCVNIQFIDGINVVNPTDPEVLRSAKAAGNTITHGVEQNGDGKIVAFHVLVKEFDSEFSWNSYKTKRIEAFGKKTGRVTAKLIFGSNKYKIDSVRGMGILAAILEIGSVLNRYKDSVVKKAEELANQTYYAEHKEYATGENIKEAEILDFAASAGVNIAQETYGYNGNAVPDGTAKKINASTKGTFYNMPIGSTLKTLEVNGQLEFESFYKNNFGAVSAYISVPPEVGSLAFNSNYTAAQLAASFFRHTVTVRRQFWANQAYKPFVELMLEAYQSSGLVNLPYYDRCKSKGWIALDALLFNEWDGDPIPKADPLKEAKASRELIGESGARFPLTSLKREARKNNIGDWNGNIESFKSEYDFLNKLGLVDDLNMIIEETTEVVEAPEKEPEEDDEDE